MPSVSSWCVAGSVRVRVVGTRFRVERSGERTRVSVSEGKVEVQEGDARTTSKRASRASFRACPRSPSEEPPSRQRRGRARALLGAGARR